MKQKARRLLTAATALLWVALIAVLIVATVLEKRHDTSWAQTHVYGAWWFVGLWAAAAAAAIGVIIDRKMWRRPLVLTLHAALIVILSGAFLSYLAGERGTLHLRYDTPTTTFELNGEPGATATMPFAVTLEDFHIENYPGTMTPADFVSRIAVSENGRAVMRDDVSMNRIARHRGYRFYQSGYDSDLGGVTLSVAHDPAGIAVTYTGYALLFISFLWLLLKRVISDARAAKRAVAASLLLMAALSAGAEPKVLPADVAAAMGNLYVNHNGRVSPLKTVAKEFTVRIYGKPTYRGLTAEQVFTGWMFFHTSWSQEPMFKLKRGAIRDMVADGRAYASLADFRKPQAADAMRQAVEQIQHGSYHGESKSITDAYDKIALIQSLYGGELLKIYPHRLPQGLAWYSQNDPLPADASDEEYVFVRKWFDHMFEAAVLGDYATLSTSIAKLREYQEAVGGSDLPSPGTFRIERLYNSYGSVKPLMMLCMTAGILLLIWSIVLAAKRREASRVARGIAVAVASIALLWLTAIMAAEWIITGHIPLSNGPETMQFMAWVALLIALIKAWRSLSAGAYGITIAGMACTVCMMSEATPRLTLLMPVLQSPLLTIHVMLVMIAYVLLAFLMLNAIAALAIGRKSGQLAAMTARGRTILYAALFFLSSGIFSGAVWANISWGTYWSWDPKEVWALITLLTYAAALHPSLFPFAKRERSFHIFAIAAFLTVIITYFGVNYFLGGMHSYA